MTLVAWRKIHWADPAFQEALGKIESRQMTKKAFLDTYYPRPASEAAAEGPRAALVHGIQKWQGVADVQAGRIKGLAVRGHSVVSGTGTNLRAVLYLYNDTCALCHIYFPENGRLGGYPNCAGCPLEKPGLRCRYSESPWAKVDAAKLVQIMETALQALDRGEEWD